MPLKPRKTCRGPNAASSFTQSAMATTRSGLVCVTLAPVAGRSTGTNIRAIFFDQAGRHGYGVVHFTLNRGGAPRHALRGECGRRRLPVLVAAPGVKGDRCMMHAHTLVY